jgi:hypothetical protein
VKALIVANDMLERELADLDAKASHAFIRGWRVNPKQAWRVWLIVNLGAKKFTMNHEMTTTLGKRTRT